MNIEFFQDLKSGDDNSLFECSNELTKVLTSNNLLFAISQKKMNLEDIERLSYRVMHIVASLGLDKLVLEENALIYNYQYGTSDNQFFRNHPKTLNHRGFNNAFAKITFADVAQVNDTHEKLS